MISNLMPRSLVPSRACQWFYQLLVSIYWTHHGWAVRGREIWESPKGLKRRRRDFRLLEIVLLEMSLGSRENDHRTPIISAKAKSFIFAKACVADSNQASKLTQRFFIPKAKGSVPCFTLSGQCSASCYYVIGQFKATHLMSRCSFEHRMQP